MGNLWPAGCRLPQLPLAGNGELRPLGAAGSHANVNKRSGGPPADYPDRLHVAHGLQVAHH